MEIPVATVDKASPPVVHYNLTKYVRVLGRTRPPVQSDSVQVKTGLPWHIHWTVVYVGKTSGCYPEETGSSPVCPAREVRVDLL